MPPILINRIGQINCARDRYFSNLFFNNLIRLWGNLKKVSPSITVSAAIFSTETDMATILSLPQWGRLSLCRDYWNIKISI